MESMSNAPYALPQARTGYRMGPGKMVDVMIHDGLWDPYGDKHMGTCAEACVAKYNFTRESQDAFSRESYRRAQDAVKRGKFAKAIDIVLRRAKMTVDDIDLFEVNEAFAAVALAAMEDAKIPHAKMNVNGGAVALGHPIGASGARILVTLLYALEARNLKRGMAAICIGGGEAAAMIVERM